MKQKLIELGACNQAVEWVGDKDIVQAVADCRRADWMLWLARKSGCDKRLLVLAAGRCAATVKHLMLDERLLRAIEVCEAYGLGSATGDELVKAAKAAYAVFYHSDEDSYAAESASFVYINDYGHAAYCAYKAAYEAAEACKKSGQQVADHIVEANEMVAIGSEAARTKNQLETANICRDLLGEFLINKYK